MTTAMITRNRTIRSRHPVREDFSGCSTGNMTGSGRTGYYDTKGYAVRAFDEILLRYRLWLDRDDLSDFHGNMGRKTIDVYDKFGVCGHAVLAWYRMENSGRYEFIGYLT